MAAGIDLVPSEGLANQIAAAGERMFGWPSPDGLPDTAGYFLTTNGMRRRWELVIGLADNAWKNGILPPPAGYGDAGPTPRAVATMWVTALNGAPDAEIEGAILEAIGLPPDQPMGAVTHPDIAHKAARIAAYGALTSNFQVC